MKKSTKNTDGTLHQIIRDRWSPQAFADRSIDDATLRTLFEAARWAPSSFNEQPWAFVVARRDDTAEFARALDCMVPFNQDWAKSAGAVVLTVAHATFARNDKPNAHAFHDVGLAVAQLTAQATSAGLGVHQMAGFDAGKARETYGIPAGWDPVTMVAIGYYDDSDEPGERSRKPLAEMVYTGGWGETSPFAT